MRDNQTILAYLQVTAHTRPFLASCYERIENRRASQHAYNNAERFIYGLNLGDEYLQSSLHTPLSVQPLLLYYSLTHYLKSLLLTVDPGYPATAKVLAHGLSTRKRKRQHYRFLEDDIRIQPNGLFPYAARHLFAFETTEEKVSMDELLRPLPFMSWIYEYKNLQTDSTGEPWPELLAHFAILYNLSMLVRYEGEWWGEMEQLRDRDDYVFITQFLKESSNRIPLLIAEWLKGQFHQSGLEN
ncbi:YaaC family protein [Halobacillus salinarum]|uniref:YaaC family protein n=1 Tax=Halobacillus salinarum TaxID=2932257 RepID=A0ABY4EMA1_9BACI|nr:YaaC family protein [Halobacillus salinarum]UOQ44732.1 YaaC family protein [Halobacillus salinarum]